MSRETRIPALRILALLCAAFKSPARRAKLPLDFNQHDLRHRRVTTWLVEGKNAVHVKEALGHADLATTMGYTHLVKEHVRGLVDQPRCDEARTPAYSTARAAEVGTSHGVPKTSPNLTTRRILTG